MTRRWIVCAVLAVIVGATALAALPQSGYDLYQQALGKERAEGQLRDAIALYERIVREFASDRALVAKALVRAGQCHEKLGDAQARKAYDEVVVKYADQAEAVAEARARLAAMKTNAGPPDLPVSDERLWTAPPDATLVGPKNISPDGRYVPFRKNHAADDGLWLHDLVTGKDRHVFPFESKPQGGPQWGAPRFSADGRQIAYGTGSVTPEPGIPVELRVVGVDGAGMRVVAGGETLQKELNAAFIMPLAWTPDGKAVLILASGPKWATLTAALVSVADGAIRRVESVGASILRAGIPEALAFSPDAKYLAFSTSAGRTLVAPVDGPAGSATLLLNSSAKTLLLTWSADGRQLLFVSDRSGQTGLWSMRIVDGKPTGEPVLLREKVPTMTSWQEPGLTVSPLGAGPDGSYYYWTYAEKADVYVAEIDPSTGKAVSNPQRLNQTKIGSSVGPPRWSTDGQLLAYAWGLVSPKRFAIKSLTTGEERELVTTPAFTSPGDPAGWFPDNRSLLARDQVNGRNVFRKIDIDTGKHEVVLEESDRRPANSAELSRDGKTLFFAATGGTPSTWQLIRRELDSGRETVLFQSATETSLQVAMVQSPDGRQLAFQTRTGNRTTVRIVPVEGGDARELHQSALATLLYSWTGSGRHLLISHVDPTSDLQQVLSLPVDGGAPVPTGIAMRQIGMASLHPDGKRLAFIGRSIEMEVHVARNLLPKSMMAR